MTRVPEPAAPPPLLPTSLGWRPPVGEPLELLLGEQTFSVRPLGRRAGLVALLCEAPLGAPLPGYSTRRALRARLDGHFARHLTVFTDAAHQQRVWSWVQRPRRGPPAYRESSTPPRPEELGGGACRRRSSVSTPPERWHPPHAVLTWAELRLLPGERAAGAPTDPATAVQALVERVDHPHRLRRIWSTLLRLRVLDPACGRGDWLLAAMADLEPAYLACLERMRSFVSDQDRAAPRSRRLLDFRELLRLADGGERYLTARHFVRATVALFNLHGADASPARLTRCRRRLGARCPALPAAALQLALGDPCRGLARAEEVLRAGPAPEGERLLEEARLLARADHVLRRTAWTAGRLGEGLGEAFARLRRRRHALSAALDRRLAECQEIDVRRAGALRAWRGAARPVHPLVAFPLLSEGSGERVVRGGAP